MSAALNFTLNGRAVATATEPSTLLVDLLPGPLGLTGPHQGRGRDTGGTGLGRAIVRHVAANHREPGKPRRRPNAVNRGSAWSESNSGQ